MKRMLAGGVAGTAAGCMVAVSVNGLPGWGAAVIGFSLAFLGVAVGAWLDLRGGE